MPARRVLREPYALVVEWFREKLIAGPVTNLVLEPLCIGKERQCIYRLHLRPCKLDTIGAEFVRGYRGREEVITITP